MGACGVLNVRRYHALRMPDHVSAPKRILGGLRHASISVAGGKLRWGFVESDCNTPLARWRSFASCLEIRCIWCLTIDLVL
jgi:hypothetical protein